MIFACHSKTHKSLQKSWRAPASLEKCIQKRAQTSQQNLTHTSRVLLNKQAAGILQAAPQLIAPIISAFYTRDPGDMKSCTTMADFPKADLVDVSVKFNRCHFAQVKFIKCLKKSLKQIF